MMSLLDTHQHLIYPNAAGYSWTDDIPVLARQAFTLADYRQACAGTGIKQTVFMEAGADDADYQAETRFIAKLAADAEKLAHANASRLYRLPF